MKKNIFTLLVLLSFTFVLSQQNLSPKRISISNPSQTVIKKIKQAGIDLTCGPRFIGNNLELELGSSELEELRKSGVQYTILIDDLTTYYSQRNAIELPKAKSTLSSLKTQTKQKGKTGNYQKSLSLQNVLVGNPTQHDECSEINWPVPSNFQLGSMGGCLTVSETLAQLDLMRSLYPNLISIKSDASPTGQTTHGNSTGGTTWSGQTVYYVRISDNPDIDESSEPETLITGMTHAREVNSLMNVMYFMWYILENYNSDPFIKNVVDNQELYFIPIVNPDGLLWNEVIAPGGGGLQRKNLRPGVADNGTTATSNNVRGVDLNRNFNYYWGWDNSGSSPTTSSNTYRGPSAGSEPETQILQDFVLNHDIKVAVNHHGGLNSIVTSSYNGSVSAADSGREDEYAKICHDLTQYNRYIYGSAPNTLYEANGDANDWMLGGPSVSSGGQTNAGSGKDVLAFAPENGDDFWPTPSLITPIAVRAMRMNFLSVLYSGKFAKLHDLNSSAITSTSGNLSFGVEYLGKTYDDITLTVTPVSSNITSITSPSVQSGWTKLEQRNLSIPYTLDAGIQPNDEIEFQVTLSNNDFVLYQANYIKYYQSSLLFEDNPDVTGITNWTTSGSWGVTTDAYSGSSAITDSPSGAYSNNLSSTITLNTALDFSNTSQALIQFYAKWDLERNYDLVQLEASTNGGSTWDALCGNYNKPTSTSTTNYHLNKNTTAFRTHQSTNGDIVYDGDTMDKWVMEEIYINPSENSFLFGQSNVQFRFRLKTDASNREDDLTTTFDGFTFDDFKVISIQTPCALSVPVNVNSSNISTTEATISWDNIPSATYDLRYRIIGDANWTDVLGLTAPTSTLTGLATLTDYEVQVRSNCGASSSAYSASINFTTLDVQVNYCSSASTNVNDEYISRVQLNTIDNSSAGQFYSDFTGIQTTLTKSSQYAITITPTWTGSVYTEAYSVWIDFNKDGDFDDSGEQVFSQAPTNATSVSGNFTVPTSAVENSTRMRVSMQYNAIPTSCQTFQYGEVEDYTVVIEAAGPDTTAPVITLNGGTNVDVNQGATYTDLGATALDNVDGDISANIIVGGDTVDTNVIGSYVVTYNVNDAAGNSATEVTRTVNVVVPSSGCSGGIDAFPYSFGFEGSIGTWTQSTADDLDWLVDAGGTPSGNTGPSSAIEGTDYIYVEASGNGSGYPNKRAIITSPCFDFSGLTEAEFSFSYHMYGAADMGTIDLEISTDDGGVWTSIWSQSGNQGNSWLNVNVDLNAYVGGGVQLRFNRFVGSTWQADIALDNINLTGVEGNDTTAPVITLNGSSTIDLNVGDVYTEQGATATDDLDGDITASIVIAGDVVDTNTAGTYLVTYDVSDAAGNPATQVVRTVNVIPDTTAPVITLNGASTIDLNVGANYTEQGATATDDLDGDITANINIAGDVVDTNTAGTYLVTYDVSDAAGNPATQVVRTVNVIPDTTAPVITLNGASTIDLNVGDVYSEQGATATDDLDGDITSSIVIAGDVVDTNTAGTYLVTYDVSDAAGNPATQVVRTVNVIPDTTAPVITLNGSSSIDLNVGDVYTEQGATATDDLDGDITANIIIAGDVVDTNTAGTYLVTYDVSDAAGNPATQVVRTVNVIPDTTAPVITLNAASTIDLNIGANYTEQGATATDDLDGDITASIVIAGDVVDTNTAGTYLVTYDVSDAAGNPATQVVRTVNVIPDTTAPVITLNGASTIDLNVGDVYTEQGATATDDLDGDITASIVIGGDTVNTNAEGTYIVTYNVNDTSGNAAIEVTRTVSVVNVPTDVIIHEGYFETGWDGWIDGGSDCARRADAARSYENSYSIRIRDNSGTASSMTSPSFNLSSFNEVEFNFYFYAVSMEVGEDFWLQYNDGSGFVTVQTWARGTDFVNNAFDNFIVTLSASQFNLSSNAQFRLICDASGNNDQIYIDQVVITGRGGNAALFKTNEPKKVLDVTDNVIIKNVLKVYPNPVKGDILNIKTSKGGTMSFRIINALGQIVSTGTTSKEIIVDQLEEGMYFIEVTEGADKMMKRFIKD